MTVQQPMLTASGHPGTVDITRGTNQISITRSSAESDRVGDAVHALATIDARRIRDDEETRQNATAAIDRLLQLIADSPQAFARWVEQHPRELNEAINNMIDCQLSVAAGDAAADEIALALVSLLTAMIDLPTGREFNGEIIEYSAIVFGALDQETQIAIQDLLGTLDRAGITTNARETWDRLRSFANSADRRGRSTSIGVPEDSTPTVRTTSTNGNDANEEGNMASSVNNHSGIGVTVIPGEGTDRLNTRARMLTILFQMLKDSEEAVHNQLEVLENKPSGEVSNVEMFRLQDVQGQVSLVEDLMKGFIKDGNETTEGIAQEIFG